eukprot:1160984-Pelagomonas_calceolata.AAC.3
MRESHPFTVLQRHKGCQYFLCHEEESPSHNTRVQVTWGNVMQTLTRGVQQRWLEDVASTLTSLKQQGTRNGFTHQPPG